MDSRRELKGNLAPIAGGPKTRRLAMMRLRPGNSDESGAYSVTRARTAQSRGCSVLTAVNRIAQLLEIEEGLVAPVRELHNSNGRRTVEMRSCLARVEMTSKDDFHP